MKKVLFLCLIFLIISGLLGCTKKAEEVSKGVITGAEARTMMKEDDTILVDVRTDVEYDEDHLEGAISIPVNTPKVMIERMLKEKNARIIVYCRSGNRSHTFKETLEAMGYTNVYDLGSKDNWNK